jgi:hypothetical protein
MSATPSRNEPPVAPVDVVVISFPGSKFKGDIVPAIKELVDAGTVRILDLVFVQKTPGGGIEVVELNDLGQDEASAFDDLDGEVDELLTDDDIMELCSFMADGDAAALLVWENTWATRAAAAIRAADGELVSYERIPTELMQAAWLAAAPA